MFNAANKFLAATLAVAALSACTSEAERRAAAAEDLRSQAESMVAAGNYDSAMSLLDSIDSAYREQTEVRRNSLATRAAAIEGNTLQLIGPAEERLARAQLRTDSLSAMFIHVDGPRGLEGYNVAKELAGKDVTAATGIQPRLDSEGYLSIAAVVKGKNIGLNSLSVTTSRGTIQTEPQGSDRVVNSEGTELASFRQEEVADVLQALAEASATTAKMHLDGSKGSVEIKLTPDMRTALVRSWEYAMALQELRAAHIERERLERVLHTARDHRANAQLPAND